MAKTKTNKQDKKDKTPSGQEINLILQALAEARENFTTLNEFYKKLLSTLTLAPEDKPAVFQAMWQSAPRALQAQHGKIISQWFNWMDPLNITAAPRSEGESWTTAATEQMENSVAQLVKVHEKAVQTAQENEAKWTAMAKNLGLSAVNFRATECENLKTLLAKHVPMTPEVRKQLDTVAATLAENLALSEKIKDEMTDFNKACAQWHKSFTELNDLHHLEAMYEQFMRPVVDGQDKLKEVTESAFAAYPAAQQVTQRWAENYRLFLELNPFVRNAETALTAFAASLKKVRETAPVAAPAAN